MNKEMKDFKHEHEDKDMHKHDWQTIIVNGVRHETQEKKLSFEELIQLAFGRYDAENNVAYTVTYSCKNGNHSNKGILVAGDSVNVKEGMVFNVTKTTRS